VKFSIKQGSPENLRTACLIAGVFDGNKLSAAAQALDKACKGQISQIVKRGDLSGKAGSTLLLQKLPGIAAERILLVGLGKASEINNKTTVDIVRGVFGALGKLPAADASLCLDDGFGKDMAFVLRQAVIAAAESVYRADSLKSKPAKPATLKTVTFLTHARPAAQLTHALAQAEATANGMDLAKTLGNLPGNVCTPSYLASQAQAISRKHRTIKTTVLDEKAIKRLDMGSFLSVTQGSEQPPRLITLEYYGAADKKKKPIVLVGKGITFDSGGISLKPGAEMDEMKYDMCGAASVLGTMQAVAEMGLKLNVVGVIPSCENLPSGKAVKPGDIVTSMSGQTIEILNTDAEGRLILCDALTYSKKFNPDTVIDIATLTGACVIALGHVASGMFANEDKLAQELTAAANESHDRIWQLPLWDDYQPLLDSNFADMQNIGGRAGGTITAACFLARFTKEYRWAHLDIAGTAWKSGKEKGSTGRPVPLLTQYLINRANGK
jgi:leucyl aminopeptidase